MNLYDFDGTLYRGDASVDFWRFALRRHPQLVRFLPGQGWAVAMLMLGLIDRGRAKAGFFRFLNGLPYPEQAVADFWQSRSVKRRAAWYQPSRKDCVITASPDFLIRACPWLEGLPLIATRMDPRTGELLGANCRGAEKVRRFRETFPKATIDGFWSDSLSDAPLAHYAQTAWWVRRGRCVPWPQELPLSHSLRVHFCSSQFLRFILCGGFNVLTGVGFAWGFSFLLQANAAFVTGYLLSLFFSYLLNASVTFHARPTFPAFLRYAIAYLPNFLIQNLTVALIYNLLAWPKLLAYLLSALLGIPLTFLALKCFAFRA